MRGAGDAASCQAPLPAPAAAPRDGACGGPGAAGGQLPPRGDTSLLGRTGGCFPARSAGAAQRARLSSRRHKRKSRAGEQLPLRRAAPGLCVCSSSGLRPGRPPAAATAPRREPAAPGLPQRCHGCAPAVPEPWPRLSDVSHVPAAGGAGPSSSVPRSADGICQPRPAAPGAVSAGTAPADASGGFSDVPEQAGQEAGRAGPAGSEAVLVPGGGSCPSTPAWCRARCFPGARAGERRCAVLPGPCSSAASLCHSQVPLGKRWGGSACSQAGQGREQWGPGIATAPVLPEAGPASASPSLSFPSPMPSSAARGAGMAVSHCFAATPCSLPQGAEQPPVVFPQTWQELAAAPRCRATGTVLALGTVPSPASRSSTHAYKGDTRTLCKNHRRFCTRTSGSAWARGMSPASSSRGELCCLLPPLPRTRFTFSTY